MNSMKIESAMRRIDLESLISVDQLFFFLKIKYSGSALRANGLIVFVGFVN